MKKRRHRQILQMISDMDIETQEELVEQLMKVGFQVTQATVSRDIRELNLTKVSNGKGKQKYVAIRHDDRHLSDRLLRVLKEGFVSMDMAQNILVVKTVSGMAMAVAAALDAMELHEIVGSIAGDDTIMLAVRTVEDTKTAMSTIQEMMED